MLEKDARAHARMSHYEMAERLAREAQEMKESVQNEAQNDLHREYIEKRQKMDARHQALMKNFESKLETDIRGVRLDYQRECEVTRRRLFLMAHKFGLSITDQEVDKLISQYPLADDEDLPKPQSPPRKTVSFSQSPWRRARTPNRSRSMDMKSSD